MLRQYAEIVDKYLNIIMPSFENGSVSITGEIIQEFLDLMHGIFRVTIYSSEHKEIEFRNKLMDYYEKGNINGIIGIMYAFLQSAFAILSIQSATGLYKNESYKIQCGMSHLLNEKQIEIWEIKHTFDEKKRFMGKGVVYTAITGNYDQPDDNFVKHPDFDYILFTDNPNMKSDVWKVVYLDNKEGLDRIRLARKMKILGYQYLQDYDYSIWMDGNIRTQGDIKEYINNYRGKAPILCFPHYSSKCVYEEYEACCSLKKDNTDIMKKQVLGYQEEGYPKNNGMVDTCILIRELKHDKLNQVMDCWWNEIITKSYRDQLSFNYAFWKNDYVYNTSDLYCYNNPYFVMVSHNR